MEADFELTKRLASCRPNLRPRIIKCLNYRHYRSRIIELYREHMRHFLGRTVPHPQVPESMALLL